MGRGGGGDGWQVPGAPITFKLSIKAGTSTCLHRKFPSIHDHAGAEREGRIRLPALADAGPTGPGGVTSTFFNSTALPRVTSTFFNSTALPRVTSTFFNSTALPLPSWLRHRLCLCGPPVRVLERH